jgi:hypothetical protein
MWEYVQTIPTGSALGQKVKNAIRGVGLPQLRGMAPGMLEDAQAALNPGPVINAVVGSGYPQCRLVKMPVGDFDGKIHNVDGNLLVDPEGILIGKDGRYYQQHWVQDRDVPPVRRAGETEDEQYMRGEPIQLAYDAWDSTPKLYGDNGCLLDPKSAPAGTIQPKFCGKLANSQVITLPDNTKITAYTDGFEDYNSDNSGKSNSIIMFKPYAPVSFSLAIISIVGLFAFWSLKKK